MQFKKENWKLDNAKIQNGFLLKTPLKEQKGKWLKGRYS